MSQVPNANDFVFEDDYQEEQFMLESFLALNILFRNKLDPEKEPDKIRSYNANISKILKQMGPKTGQHYYGA